MNLVKCNRGHFYDAERYNTCPHCERAGIMNDNLTVPINYSQSNDEVTVALSHSDSGSGSGAPSFSGSGSISQDTPTGMQSPPVVAQPLAGNSSLQDAVSAAVQGSNNMPVDDDNKTVGFFSSLMGMEPVVGWLVCITGEHFGEDFRLKSGRNFIGRGNNMDVSITKDPTVSRDRHAVVVYEPRGNVFLMQPGDSKELCYLNDEVVLSPQMLNSHDKILVGKTELIFIPCCTVNFNWESVEKKEN